MILEPIHSNKLFQSILDCVGLGIVVVDIDGRVIFNNPVAESLLGANISGTSPVNWSATYGIFQNELEAPLPDDFNPIFSSMRGELVSSLEVYVRNDKFLSGGWCDIRVSPLFDNHGVHIGGVIVIQDVTAAKRLSTELERSNRDLQEFAYVAAHDLQEPLRTITGFGDLLEANTRGKLDEKSADQLKRMIAAAKRMQTLIAAVLLYARVETKAKVPVVCSAKALVEDAISDLNSKIRDANAEVQVEVNSNVLVDRSQVTQLFQNIIANSIKYRSDDPPLVKITERPVGSLIEFTVIDNGIGFEMSYADKIFVLFKRLHSKESYEGVGVGLSICKKIVERHGGVIRAHSELGAGTKIIFTLPRAHN
jgi:PAS domain S-box-containing protein